MDNNKKEVPEYPEHQTNQDNNNLATDKNQNEEQKITIYNI